MKRLLLIIAFSVFPSIVFAQKLTFEPRGAINAWAKENKVFVPKSTRSALAERLLTMKFAGPVPTEHLLTAQQYQSVYKAVESDGTLYLDLLTSDNPAGTMTTGDGNRYELDSTQAVFIFSALTTQKIAFELSQFPKLQLTVMPIPPNDHSLSINGKPSELNDNGVYLVPAGTVEVEVKRTGKNDCVWKGVLKAGESRNVRCVF